MKKKKNSLGIIIALIVQTIIFVIVGMNKQYIHMDEAYSLGLASYDKVEIQDNDDFYGEWHDGKYYEDYIVLNDDEVSEFSQVYENQKNDVHPPFYYLLLRIMMMFSVGEFSKWPGIILNIMIYDLITIFMYLILKKMFKKREHGRIAALLVAFLSSITLASLSSVIYIRMYALSTLNVVITTYLHMLLLDSKKLDYKLLGGIFGMALIGSLTHYYYLFYLFMLFIMFVIRYVREKRWQELSGYAAALVLAAGASLLIFPYSIQHMFFGYRGQGAISNLLDIAGFLESLRLYVLKINEYVFNGLLFAILSVMVVGAGCKKIKGEKIFDEKNKYILYILFPTLFYFMLVAVSAPWIELRYVMPITGMMFILVLVLFDEMFIKTFKGRMMFVLVAIMMVSPIMLGLRPEVMYVEKENIVEKVQNELNVPTLYAFNLEENRFLDDILLFSKLDESYVAKNLEYNEENVKEIMAGRDLSRGMLVFINQGQENDEILEVITGALGLSGAEWIERLNACDVYYLK